MSGTEDEEHSSAIKTPKQLITVIVAAFVFPVLIIMLIGHLVTGNPPVDSDSPAFSNQAVAKRLKPVGTLALASDSLQPEVSSMADPGWAARASAAPVAASGEGDKIKTILGAEQPVALQIKMRDAGQRIAGPASFAVER